MRFQSPKRGNRSSQVYALKLPFIPSEGGKMPPRKHQTRLDLYFGNPRPHSSSVLTIPDLPLSVRNRIYGYLDLIRDGHIHLNVEKVEDDYTYNLRPSWTCLCYRCQNSANIDSKRTCPCWPVLRLMLVCRTMYQDICAIVYSQSHFTISRNAPGGLSGLFNLGPLALASMTSLTVVFNSCQADCQENGENCFYDCQDCMDWIRSNARKPLSLTIARNDQTTMREWRNFCNHVAQSIETSRLRLCLICDVDSYGTAEKYMEPMHHLPLLSACSIRLSTKSNTDLRQLAESTTLKLTGRSNSGSVPSQLSYLPVEIQMQILQHTDLVAPHDLQLVPEYGYICRTNGPNNVPEPAREGWRALNPCELCIGVHRPCYERMRWECSLAFQCWCWRFPLELFLVCREFHREAIRLFYSRNHIYIHPPGSGQWPWKGIDKCSSFFKRLPVEAVPHLRSLQVVTDYFLSWLKPGTRSAHDWAESINILVRHADVSRLSLTIDGSRSLGDFDSYCENPREQDERGWERDQRIVNPLVRLNGLKNFFVHLAYPMYSPGAEIIRKNQERILEKRVMGEHYDSVERGKYLVPGRWWDVHVY